MGFLVFHRFCIPFGTILSRNLKRIILLGFLLLGCGGAVRGQSYLKLNGLYALVGVINPAVEIRVSDRWTYQAEIVYSPWQSINDHGVSKPMHFGICLNEIRRYFRERNDGWYVGLNAGMMLFKMSKPELRQGRLYLENRYSKGGGLMVGLCVGYEYAFARKWVLDAYLGWAYMLSWYNGYSLDGKVDLYPHRPEMPAYPDPYNGSGEWYPNKIGVSVGIWLFDPVKRAARKAGRIEAGK